LKRSAPENTSFRDKLKEKGAGLKIDFTKTSSILSPLKQRTKEEGDMEVTEEKVNQQIEHSSNQFSILQSGLCFEFDVYNSANFPTFHQPACSPLGSFNMMVLHNTEDDVKRYGK